MYQKNLFGDIIGIYNENGTQVVWYEYDAWGNLTYGSYTTGNNYVYNANPFRYRGYYYDRETGFYYLQTRYYDPVTCRFINGDCSVNANGDLLGFNMFAYCSNNPVMNVDFSGESFFSISIGFSSVVFGFGLSGAISLSFSDNDWGLHVTKYASDEFISGPDNQMIGVNLGINIDMLTSDENWVTSIHDVDGKSYSVGGDALCGYNTLINEEGRYCAWGIGTSTFSAGWYKLATTTNTLFSLPTLNLPKLLKEWSDKIFG